MIIEYREGGKNGLARIVGEHKHFEGPESYIVQYLSGEVGAPTTAYPHQYRLISKDSITKEYIRDFKNGITTTQLKLAPRNALYVCTFLNECLDCKKIAKNLGRGDLLILTSDLVDRCTQGKIIEAIVIDHRTILSDIDYACLIRKMRV